MSEYSALVSSQLCFVKWWRGILCALLTGAAIVLTTAWARAEAEKCPRPEDEIATDRPDVTNSSVVVPFGSFQSENGIILSRRDGAQAFDGTNSRLRLGIAPCLELLVDLPSNVTAFHGFGASGFTNLAPAVKWQISPIPEKS